MMLITKITPKKRTLKFLHDHHDDINDHDDHDNDQDDHDNDDIDCIYHLKRTINVITIIMTITFMIENPEKVCKTFAQKCYLIALRCLFLWDCIASSDKSND